MKFNINDLFLKFNYNEDKKNNFRGFLIKDVALKKADDLVIFKIDNDIILPFSCYEDLKEYFNTLGFGNTKFLFTVKDKNISIQEATHYLRYFKENSSFFSTPIVLKENDSIFLSYMDEEEKERDEQAIDDLTLFFYSIGYAKGIEMVVEGKKELVIETRPPIPESEVVTKQTYTPSYSQPDNKPNYYQNRVKEYQKVTIDDLLNPVDSVEFTGQIFKVEEIVTRAKNIIQTIWVKDTNNACVCKMIENRKNTKEILALNKEGKWANFYGNYSLDAYTNSLVFMPDKIEFIDCPIKIEDNQEEKRVELHAHTKLSEMDGVSSPEDIVNMAYKYGHKAVAITDHLCLQGFHPAQMAYSGIKKKDPDTKFKIIYGCEFNMVNPHFDIVYNPTNNLITDEEYVVFDLESTGLSTEYDYIIEFGAVVMYKGTVKERKDFFIKPPVMIDERITAITHISNNDVKNARTFAECKDEILDFIKGRVLVAHNAAFDFNLLNTEFRRIGHEPIKNTCIDTLPLSRSMFMTRKAFRLGNMARQYGVEYDEEVAHRADYDAEVLASIFNLMLKDLQKEGLKTINDLANHQGGDAFVKNRAMHTTVLCKNQKGVKDLFKLVSISNTTNLAVFGKSNGSGESEYMAEPRIFKENINKYRENLLVGTACLNGEVFETAHTRTLDKLEEVISFYDYVEIQPLDAYKHYVYDRQLFTADRLKQYIKDIISIAKKLGKPVVATGDVHYATKEEHIVRDVYVNAQGIGGVHHPLFIYDKEKRAKQITPDQHFYNTKEMLEAFEWLEDEDLIREIVIDNPNKIADMCDVVMPFNNTLYPPKIDDAIARAKSCDIEEEPFVGRNDVISADDYLKELVYYTVHKQYGENLDKLISDRLERELNAIIGNGYGVIYYVCHLMVKRSNLDGYIVGSRGSVGSSLVATMSGITEVNALPPHYICPKCHHLEWIDGVASGYDLPSKVCPECGCEMKGDGQNIPFETFLGFHGDKVPDIDLNFSGDYQPVAHLFTRKIFGDKNAFRAGTTLTVKDKTAFGYISRYCEEKGITNMSRAQKERLVQGAVEVKRTTGMHAGGVVVLPDGMDIEDVTPIQYPANDKNSNWLSTHFEFHDYSDNLLKFDILGHVDPTAMRLFENISGIDVKTIPMNDPKVLSLFTSSSALNIINPNYHEVTGACGLPEFGTRNSRNTIEETKPTVFSDLVQISGLSHGTDVWQGNAQELIRKGLKLADVIGCRDDIMSTLISYKLESKDAFSIMEHVRKGKGLTPEEEKLMLDHDVPGWYIESCKKIKYMFPKAHAVAYCIMAVRVAWFKVYYPAYYYVHYLSIRCDAYELETMTKDADSIMIRMKELDTRRRDRENPLSVKEVGVYDTLEVCYEMNSRGYHLANIDLYKSKANEFTVNPDNDHEIIPPFTVLDGLGENVAVSIVKAREEREFISKEDLTNRTQLSGTLLKKLDDLGVLEGLDDSNQMSLF